MDEKRLNPDTGSATDEDGLLRALRALYRSCGYRSYRMSKFEKYELYAGYKDFLVSDRVITFNDVNGELLALKPDVTLSIVRSTDLGSGVKQKLRYQENVYRPEGSGGQFREILQCGLECLGDLDSYDVSEVLKLARESLLQIPRPSILSVSHLGILRSLIRRLGTDGSGQMRLLELLAGRNIHELKALFVEKDWDPGVFQDLQRLLRMRCTLKELPSQLRQELPGRIDEDVLQELEELSCLEDGPEGMTCFDASVINDIHYYNGIVFQGFVQGVSEKVLSGGRYDRLLKRMGKPGGAVGFAVYFGLLEQCFDAAEEPDADVLLLYDAFTPLTEIRDTVRSLREKNLRVSAQKRIGGTYREILDLRGGNTDA